MIVDQQFTGAVSLTSVWKWLARETRPQRAPPLISLTSELRYHSNGSAMAQQATGSLTQEIALTVNNQKLEVYKAFPPLPSLSNFHFWTTNLMFTVPTATAIGYSLYL